MVIIEKMIAIQVPSLKLRPKPTDIRVFIHKMSL